VWFSDKLKAELLAMGLATKVPIGTATTPVELLSAPGLWARDAREHVAGGVVPGRPFPGLGWRAPTEPVPPVPPVPPVGSVPPVPPVGSARATIPSGGSHGLAPAPLPLQGVRVLDLTMMWAGPFATMRLAEMGAEVIKIESPSAWDNIRTLIPQPGAEDPWNSAFYFNAYNRDKRSLTLDLAQDAGRDLLLRLVEQADVLIENYRADVLDKLYLSPEVLLARNPRLVVVSMAAFGKEGPDRDFVGFGPVIELMSGLASLSGYGDGEPFKTGISYGDPVAGTAAVAAVSLALLRRERTGEGVHIDLAQRETGMALIAEQFVAASRGEEPVHRGCGDARFEQGCFRADGDDDWVVVSVPDDAARTALAGVIGASSLEDWVARRSASEAQAALQAAGVPAGRVIDTVDLLEDPHLAARGYWVELPHPRMHAYRQQGAIWRLAEGRPAPRRHSPLFGEHNEEILVGELGLGPTEMAALRTSHVIADAPINPGVG
jgi:crotonobetainyl-CoA:carnitine CoA-transferase CaiB-like acyl-CoA transferase